MSGFFKRSQQHTKQFLSEQESTWREMTREQDKALITFAAEESVARACYALEAWFRSIARWHEWVSEDMNRYVEAEHKEWQLAEQRMIQGVKLTSDILKILKETGHQLAREKEFRVLADELASATGIEGTHEPAVDLRKLKSEAVNEHRAAATEEITHWGE